MDISWLAYGLLLLAGLTMLPLRSQKSDTTVMCLRITCLIVILLAGGLIVYSQNIFDASNTKSPAGNQQEFSTWAEFGHRLFRVDRFGHAMQLVTLSVGYLLAFVTLGMRTDREAPATTAGLLLMTVAGITMLCAANNLVLIVLALEISSMTSWWLVIGRREPGDVPPIRGRVVGPHLLGSLLFVLGVLMLIAISGSASLDTIGQTLADGQFKTRFRAIESDENFLGRVATILIFTGLAFRLLLVPFHAFVLPAFERLSLWQVGVVTLFSQWGGLIVMIRLLVLTLSGFEMTTQILAAVFAATTLSGGALVGFRQTSLRRLLVSFSIVHSGLAMLGIAAGMWYVTYVERVGTLSATLVETAPEKLATLPPGVMAAVVSFGIYFVSAVGLVALLIHRQSDRDELQALDELAGWFRREPLSGLLGAVLLLSIAGVPPLCGFWGRAGLFGTALSSYIEFPESRAGGVHTMFLALCLIASAAILMLVASVARIILTMMEHQNDNRSSEPAAQSALAVALLCALLIVAGGIFPDSLFNGASSAHKGMIFEVERNVRTPTSS